MKAMGSDEILPYPELQAFLKDQFEKYNGEIQSTGLRMESEVQFKNA